MKANRFLALFTALMMMCLLVACSGSTGTTSSASPASSAAPASSAVPTSSTAPEEFDLTKKPITLLVGFNPGGGMDTCARALQPSLEKVLGGATVNVVNKPGASGWVSWEETASASPDGYTIAMVALPTFYPGYMDPSTGRSVNLDSFELLANQVTDSCILICRKDEDRFNTIQEYMEYAKENEVTVGTAGIGSDDDFLLKTIAKATGAKLTAVPGAGWSEFYPAMLGGHIDVAHSNVGEAMAAVKDGECKVLAIFAKERSSYMPDVPTWNESGFGVEIEMASNRGVIMPAGGDPALVRYLSEKIGEAMNSQEHKDMMIQLGLEQDYMGYDEYNAFVRAQEAQIWDMRDLFDW